MAGIYDIDFNKMVRWNTPEPMQDSFWLTLLGVLIKPITDLYGSFKLFMKAVRYDLMITPQVCYLEAMLNDRYDSALRRIYIADAATFPQLYLYQDAENQPVNLYTDSENQPVYLYTDGESVALADDFVVMVPVSVVFDAAEMRSLVKKKRLPGMKFKIQTF